MELASIDPHSLKEHTKIHEIPKFGVNRPNSKQDTAIKKCQNFTKKCMVRQRPEYILPYISP